VSPRLAGALAAVLAVISLAAPSAAKKFRYAAGPKPQPDTSLSVAEVDVEPIVRARGPRVPATNLQLIEMVANTGFDRALATAPIDTGGRVIVAPVSGAPLNYVIEHAILKHLSKRRISVTVRRQPVPDDSTLAQVAIGSEPVLEYQLGATRISYLRLVGWLPGRVRIERQAQVEGQLVMRDPVTRRVLWTGDASYNLLDSFPRGQLSLVEDPRNPDLKSPVPDRNIDKVIEPVIVLAIISGLVALFFQNRP
jgi:hypothetical protein